MLDTLTLCSNVSIQVSSRYKELEEIGSSYTTIHSLYTKSYRSMGCSQVPYRQRDRKLLQSPFVARPSLSFSLRLPGYILSSLKTTITITRINNRELKSYYCKQWAAGFVTYWYPGGSRNSRASLMSWHVFLGVYIYALAIVTATTGILEKLTFLQVNQVITRYSTEAMLVNTTGVLILILGGFVILGVVTPVNGKTQVLTQ